MTDSLLVLHYITVSAWSVILYTDSFIVIYMYNMFPILSLQMMEYKQRWSESQAELQQQLKVAKKV